MNDRGRDVNDGPLVWCLLGRKAGDNTQVRALADELGVPWLEKRIRARPWELLVHLFHRPTLAGIDGASAAALAPPWPDLVISAGRRSEPVARWIRRQSGDRTRLVHVGRPWAPLDSYDLIVSTPQYFLPSLPNVRVNQLPLNRLPAEDLAAAGAALEPELRHLARPRIAVLAGGDSGKYVFTAAKGRRLGLAAVALAEGLGGSLMVTDSPRTPRAAGDALQAALRDADYCRRWGLGGVNPYLGMLALADAFVVTGESMSMLGEAVGTGKPVHIFDIGDGDQPWWLLLHNYRYKPLSHRLAMALGPRRMRRDVSRIHRRLVDAGRAVWLPAPGGGAAGRRPPEPISQLEPQGGSPDHSAQRELAETAAEVRRLLTAR